MTSVRASRCRAALAALLAVATVLAAPSASSPAAIEAPLPTPGVKVSAEPPDVLGRARLDASAAQAIARRDQGLRTAFAVRPDGLRTATYSPASGLWTVRFTDRHGLTTLASVTVDDATGTVAGSEAIPVTAYPPRLLVHEAIRVARASREVHRAARAHGGVRRLEATARLEDGDHWEVDFADSREVRVRVEVDDATGAVRAVWTGHQIAWSMARGNRLAFGGEINRPWIWLPTFLLFALLVVDWMRVRSMYTADVVALLSLGVSHEAFQRGALEWSVPLAVPPLAWLFCRMGWLFVRGVRPARHRGSAVRPTPDAPAPPVPPANSAALSSRWTTARAFVLRPVPTAAIVVLAVFLGGARWGLDAYATNVVDVGYAGVAGARLELDGRSPYGNMPDDNQRGDTYGPLNYLLYVPAVALFDDAERDTWGESMPAARAVGIASDILCALTLALIGVRWLSRRAAALMVAAWFACPWTLWPLASNSNDLLVAWPLLLGFAALPRPWLRGGLVACAAAIKFVPLAALAPLLHAGGFGRRRQAALTILGAALVVAACWAWLAHHDGGTARFAERTFGFQVDRESPFSPWGLYGWHTAQRIAQAVLAVLLLAACVVPRARDFRQVAAGMAATMLGVQLVLQHYTYLYAPWFVGFVIIVLAAAREQAAPAAGDAVTGTMSRRRGAIPMLPAHDLTDGDIDHPRSLDPGGRLVAHGRRASRA